MLVKRTVKSIEDIDNVRVAELRSLTAHGDDFMRPHRQVQRDRVKRARECLERKKEADARKRRFRVVDAELSDYTGSVHGVRR